MLHVYKLYKAAESSNKYLPPFTKRHVFNNSLLRHFACWTLQGGVTVNQIRVSWLANL